MKRMKIREEGSEHVKREFKKNVHRRQTHKVQCVFGITVDMLESW
jgi:hypothetical protein